MVLVLDSTHILYRRMDKSSVNVTLRRTIKPVYLLVIIMGLALLVTIGLAGTISSWRLGMGSGQLMNAYNGNTGLIRSNVNVEVRQHASQTPVLGMGTSIHGRGQGTPSLDGMLSRIEQGGGIIDWSLYRREQANTLRGINQVNAMNSHVADIGRENLPLDDQLSRIQQGNVMDSRISGRVQGNPSFADLLSRERGNTSRYNALHSLVRERFLPNYYLRGRRDERTGREYKESQVVFLHVHKCGGTSIKDTLSRIAKVEVHSMSAIDKCFGQGSTGGSRCDSLRAGDDSRRHIFMGARTFGLCDLVMGRPCSYFTVLREPVDRIVSSYLFCQEADYNCAEDVAGSSITDWALRKGSKFFSLLHWSEFVSRQGRVVITMMDKETKRSVLDYFLQNLENWFSFIGITEEMDMSMNMLADVYGFHIKQGLKKNEGRTKSRMDQQQLDNMRETLRSNSTVMKALYEDIMLYRKGKEIFQEQVKQFNNRKW